MDEIGYVCPKCGNTDAFEADAVMFIFDRCRIDAEGWDCFDSYGEGEFLETTNLECLNCGYEDNWHMFEKGYENE